MPNLLCYPFGERILFILSSVVLFKLKKKMLMIVVIQEGVGEWGTGAGMKEKRGRRVRSHFIERVTIKAHKM